MTKEMFLNDLKRELNNMNRIDREKTIAYYEEMIVTLCQDLVQVKMRKFSSS